MATHGPNRLAEVQPLSTLERLLHESLTDGSQLLLLGAMVIGLHRGTQGEAAMQPFTGDLFKGMLAFFLLDMGLLAARNMGELRGKPAWLLAYAVAAPPVHAGLALLMVLAASASYIAVPAVIRHAIPEARPSLYIGMSLGLTFPLNILLGIPVYTAVAKHVLA
nr:sodium-dependent bicarbonate transport family permease [Polaromonas sp. AET17H-212]